ncbi:MAG: hypothetical protein QW734_03765 [Candidatus Bathyarchaeia archaeon]
MNRDDLNSKEYKAARDVINIFLSIFPDIRKQLESYLDKFLQYADKPEMQPIIDKYIKCDISILKRKDIAMIVLSFFNNEQERINKTLYSIYLYLKKIYE